VASKRFDPLKERLRFSLQRNQQDAALEAQRIQVEALSEMLERRARIAQLSQEKREADIDAVTKFREAKQKEAEKRAQARARLEGKKKPPTLSPPSPINMSNPGASLGDAPFAMENFGMPGGPQPGGPGTAGNPVGQVDPTGSIMPTNAQQLLGQVGQLAPFLTQQTTRQATTLQETMPGVKQFIPVRETTTRVQPNVLSARSAALIQLELARDRQKSMDLYLDRVAQMAQYAEGDPTANRVATAELIRIAQTNPALLDEVERRMGAIAASDMQWGLRNPKQVAGGPTGRMWEAGNQVIGQPAPASGLEAGLGKLAGSLEGLGQILSDDNKNKLQEEIFTAGGRLAGLLQMRESFDPKFLTTFGGGVKPWITEKALRLVPSLVDPKVREEHAKFNDLKAAVATYFRSFATSEGGKALTATEIETINPITPKMEDSAVRFIAKWDRAAMANAMTIARTSYLLKSGILTEESIGSALAKRPHLQFEFREGSLSPGEEEMLRIMELKEQEIAMKLRAEMAQGAQRLDDAAIRRKAEEQTFIYFGLPPDFGRYLEQY